MREDRDPPTDDEDEPFDDPTDPSHPDYDLSESAPYEYDNYYDRSDEKPWFLQRWVHLIIAILVIGSLILPYIVIYR